MDEWLALFLLAEEMSEFRPDIMVWRDVEMLASRSQEGMHSYYYGGDLTCRDMIALLEGHGYRADFLSHTPELTGNALWRTYLISRCLSHPLPWSGLLSALEPEQSERFPALARLQAIRTLLAEFGWTKTAVTPESLPQTLENLKVFSADERISVLAGRYGVSRPVRVRVIVEGETEKLLLPLFARAKGLDFNRLGISLLPAGGKNQVLTLYRENSHCLSVPVCVILDADAEEIARELKSMLRPGDCVFHIAEGEFEDLYDPALIVKTANQHYQLYPELTIDDFHRLRATDEAGCVRTLKRIWLTYQLGNFDKMEFAARYALVFDRVSAEIPLSSSICRMLDAIVHARNAFIATPEETEPASPNGSC